jgi:hypothetical protein
MPHSTSAVKTPIRSQFADDADFREILEPFVHAIPQRCRLLAELHRSGSLEELGRQAHQLKGAGGGYGFSEISAAGAELSLRAAGLAGESRSLRAPSVRLFRRADSTFQTAFRPKCRRAAARSSTRFGGRRA